MWRAKRVVHLVHVKRVDVSWLEEKFAVLTEEGWVIPDWLVYLRSTCKD